jgi:hypothetical protein
VPIFVALSVNIGGGGGGVSKPAVIDLEPFDPCPVIVKEHAVLVPAEAQSPPQPEKVEPLSGAAVSVSVVFCLISAEQFPGQSIEPLVGSGAGAVTCPAPLTTTVT